MKIYRSQVAVLLFVGFLNSISSAQIAPLSVPFEVQFLNRGSSPVEGQFLIRAGQVFETGAAGNEKPSTLGPLSGPKAAAFTGAVETILGAPVVVLTRQEVIVPVGLQNAKATLRAVVKPTSILFVQETRTLAPTKQVTTEFSVSQLVNDSFTTLGRFSFHENTYNQYLSEVWVISDEVLAIVTKSSRHARLNTLFIFDTRRRQLVGMREFSLLQYLPSSSSVWIAQSVANCDNIEEVFAEVRSKAQVFQLFDDKGISRDFQALDGVDGDVAKQAESGSTNDAASASLRIESPQPVKQAAEAKLTRPAPSEEPASSTPWSIVAVLIVAACGLLWLLLKGRK